MTASFRAARVHPPISASVRPANRPPDPRPHLSDPEALLRTSPEITVSITVRGEDAVSAIGPLVAAVRSMGWAEVTIDATGPGERSRRRAAELVATARPGDTTESAAPLRIIVEEYTAFLDGCPLNLTRREFDLLHFFAEHPRRVFGRSQLLQAVWGYDFSGGGRTVDVHVRRLRQKLGTRGPSISTVRGVGYRLDEAERVLVLGLSPQ